MARYASINHKDSCKAIATLRAFQNYLLYSVHDRDLQDRKAAEIPGEKKNVLDIDSSVFKRSSSENLDFEDRTERRQEM